MQGFHRRGTVVLSLALVAVGAAQVVAAVARGSGVGAYVLGVLFAAVGALRLWLERHRG